MSTIAEYNTGMNAQSKACRILNEYFNRKNMEYVAEETDRVIDSEQKIDIFVKRNDKICANIDVKSTVKVDTISYTVIDQLGRLCSD